MPQSGFRLGIYVFKDAEIVDFAAPHGVFSVARRSDPELEAYLVADAMRPVQAQTGFTVMPNYAFGDRPAMDAFLIPSGFGTRQEMYNRRLHEFVRSTPETACSRASARARGSTRAWGCSTACRLLTARSPTGSSPSGGQGPDRPARRVSRLPAA